jgi:adenylate kinase family enzyme
VRRVSVVGNSGSGKSTLARALAARLGVPHLELDSVYHQPGWQPLPVEEFVARVDAATRGDGWVVDGNYSTVRELVWTRADTVVWLDPPRRTVMRRIVWRTLRRIALRVELWNTNRERWRNLFTRDPNESVIMWAWHRHSTYRARYLAATTDPACRHLTFVRIRSRRDTRALLARAGTGTGTDPGGVGGATRA